MYSGDVEWTLKHRQKTNISLLVSRGGGENVSVGVSIGPISLSANASGEASIAMGACTVQFSQGGDASPTNQCAISGDQYSSYFGTVLLKSETFTKTPQTVSPNCRFAVGVIYPLEGGVITVVKRKNDPLKVATSKAIISNMEVLGENDNGTTTLPEIVADEKQ